MWHYVIVEIERTQEMFTGGGFKAVTEPSWYIVHKIPCQLGTGLTNEDYMAFGGCEVWIEQNRVEGSKYAIMKMFIV